MVELMKFNRLKQLCSDTDAVASALKTHSTFLKVSDDNKQIKRSVPLPENVRDLVVKRTVYAVSILTCWILSEQDPKIRALLQLARSDLVCSLLSLFSPIERVSNG